MFRYIKIGLCLSISLFFFLTAKGQQSQLGAVFEGKWIKFAKEALQESFVHVQVEYVLEEQSTKDRYGRGDLRYFNRIYTTGVLADDLLWLNKEVFDSPWDGDPLFSGYRDDEQYKPVVAYVRVLSASATEYEETTVDVQRSVSSEAIEWVGLRTSLTLENSSLSVLPEDAEIGKNGLGVILTTSEVIDRESPKLDLEIRLEELTEMENGTTVDLSILNTEAGRAGALLYPEAKGGRIIFKVYGFLHPTETNREWMVTQVTKRETVEDLSPIDGDDQENSNALTDDDAFPDASELSKIEDASASSDEAIEIEETNDEEATEKKKKKSKKERRREKRNKKKQDHTF